MANKPKRKAHPEKYRQREFLDYGDVQDYLGIRRSTLFSLVTSLDMKARKFERDRKRYLTMEQVQVLEKAINEPGFYEQAMQTRKQEAK